ncbi:MAG: barstar family protein [Brevinema sp.]
MNYNEVICLYLKEYLSDEQFEQYFYNNMDEFEEYLGENTYLEIVSTNFSSKEERIRLQTQLKQYILTDFPEIYDKISDAYVELLIQSNDRNEILEILKNKYVKKQLITIDCSQINNNKEIIQTIKMALDFPDFCGNNWNAIEDLIYDVILPEKIIFSAWNTFKAKFPEDANFIKKIFNKIDVNNSLVSFD